MANDRHLATNPPLQLAQPSRCCLVCCYLVGVEMTAVQKNCEACFAPISIRLADHKRGWGRFCDKACAAAHKCGQRPRDVNEHHAKYSCWAQSALDHRKAAGVEQWPQAPSIKAQVGKVKIKPTYHSPCRCWRCGEATSGPGLCWPCEGDEQGMHDNEAGWDGHKGNY